MIFRLMPAASASALGGKIATLIGPWLSRTAIARNNLTRAMPGLGTGQVETIINDMWNNIGRTFAEFPHLAEMDAEQIKSFAELEGLEHIHNASRSGNGSLFFTAHLANWEYAAKLFSLHGYPLHIVYRKSNNPGLESLIGGVRSHYMAGYIAKGKDGSRKIVEVLKAGGRIGMLVDQKMNDGIKVPFFGIDAMTAPAIARLALKFGCPILPVRIIRHKGVKNRVIVYPPLDLPGGEIHRDVNEIMAAINAIIESWVREYPGQWYWLHNRWPVNNDKQEEQ